jgi:hypothetical protein
MLKMNKSAAAQVNVTVSEFALDDCPTRLLIPYSNGTALRYSYQYQNGLPTEMLVEVSNNIASNQWQMAQKQVNHFNALGYPDTVSVYNRQGNNWLPNIRQIFDYNENAQVIKEVDAEWLGTQWVEYAEYRCLYAQEADTIVMTTQSKNGNEWGNESKLRYTTLPNGKFIFQELFLADDANWVLAQRVNLTYNADGKLLEQIVEILAQNISIRYSYVFDENGKVKYCNAYQKQGNNWVLVAPVEYAYVISAVGNTDFENVKVNFYGQNLTVNSPDAETIEVFSANGLLIKKFNKKTAVCTENFALPQGIYIVKGSSGWTKKIISQ